MDKVMYFLTNLVLIKITGDLWIVCLLESQSFYLINIVSIKYLQNILPFDI